MQYIQVPSEVGRAVLDITRPILTGILGTAHVGMDLDLIAKRVRAAVWKVLSLVAAFAGIGVVLSVVASRTLARGRLAPLVRTATSVAAGDLSVSTEPSTQREFPALASSFDGMISSLRNIAAGVRQSSSNVEASASQILESSRAQEAGTAATNASIEEIVYTMQSLSATADAINQHAHELSQLGDRMSERMNLAQETVITARAAIVGAADESDQVAKHALQLYEKSRSILGVVDIIDGISDRLDILALNAALEGARAGEVGKRFALVAREMRRLAENVLVSTREVKETLSLVQSLARVAATASEASASATRDEVREVEGMVEVTQTMFELISQSAGKSQQIRGITEQQRSSVTLVARAMEEMGGSASDARRLSQGVTDAANLLADVAKALRAEVERFRVAKGVARPLRASRHRSHDCAEVLACKSKSPCHRRAHGDRQGFAHRRRKLRRVIVYDSGRRHRRSRG